MEEHAEALVGDEREQVKEEKEKEEEKEEEEEEEEDDEYLYEDGWQQTHRKHIFILSASGKPIFSRYGDEQALATTFGLLQAVISVVQDQKDHLRCIKAGNRRIVYFIRNSLYFISISSTGEPEAVLAKQLEFMYNQVLLMLTDKVHLILSQNSSKDLRDLLGPDTTRLMHFACKSDLVPTCIAFEATKGFTMESALRDDLLGGLRECVESSGAALGLLMHDDALLAYSANASTSLALNVADVLLLTHFVGNSSSLRSHDQNWVPLCLPQFNAGAFLQAYVCNLRIHSMEEHRHIDLSLVLIAASADANMFKDLHRGREGLEQALLAPRMAPRLLSALDNQTTSLSKYLAPAMCLHFLFKLRPVNSGSNIPAQCASTAMSFPIDSLDSHDKIWVHYQRIGVCLRRGTSIAECTLLPIASATATTTSPSSGEMPNVMSQLPASDHALAYVVLETGHVIVGLATSDSELYATFPGTCTSLDACGQANFLSRSLRSASIFQAA